MNDKENDNSVAFKKIARKRKRQEIAKTKKFISNRKMPLVFSRNLMDTIVLLHREGVSIYSFVKIFVQLINEDDYWIFISYLQQNLVLGNMPSIKKVETIQLSIQENILNILIEIALRNEVNFSIFKKYFWNYLNSSEKRAKLYNELNSRVKILNKAGYIIAILGNQLTKELRIQLLEANTEKSIQNVIRNIPEELLARLGIVEKQLDKNWLTEKSLRVIYTPMSS